MDGIFKLPTEEAYGFEIEVGTETVTLRNGRTVERKRTKFEYDTDLTRLTQKRKELIAGGKECSEITECII